MAELVAAWRQTCQLKPCTQRLHHQVDLRPLSPKPRKSAQQKDHGDKHARIGHVLACRGNTFLLRPALCIDAALYLLCLLLKDSG